MDVDRQHQKSSAKVQCYRCRGFSYMAKDCPTKGIRSISEISPDVINQIAAHHLFEKVEEESEGEETEPEERDNTQTPSSSHTMEYPSLEGLFISNPESSQDFHQGSH